MRIPLFWAEGRAQRPRKRGGHSQVTIRRWGWSDESQLDAQRHANQRARDALRRFLTGEKLPRRERKAAYNGAEGVPIREEIVDRHGESIITRNSYGSLCLNTPDVLFADVDFEPREMFALPCLLAVLLGVAAAITTAVFLHPLLSPIALVVGAAVGGWVPYVSRHLWVRIHGGPRRLALSKLRRFLD